MRSQFICTGVALLLAPSGSLAQTENCEAPAPAKEQILLQSRAALHVTRNRADENRDFIEEARKDFKDPEKKAERRRHLDSVQTQALELVRRRVGKETMATAGRAMEVIDEKVLPEIMSEHRSAGLMLELQWGMYELSEGLLEDQAKRVAAASERAGKQETVHAACRKTEAALHEAAQTCERELQSLAETDAQAVHDRHHPAGTTKAAPHQHDMEVGHGHAEEMSRERAKESRCESLNREVEMQRTQCDGLQHASEQMWCDAGGESELARGKLADAYTMALTVYEAAASNARAEEADRKKEFGVVEAVRCLKEHFLAAVEGSVADPAWLDECNAARSESSGLDLSYEEPSSTAVAAMAMKPEQVPCTPEFVHARSSALPSGINVASCTRCTAPSEKPIATTSHGHGGHSEKFWFGFHEGVRAASGKEKGGAAHVEAFQKKLSAEGAENNLARFRAGLEEKVLHRLPGDWGESLDQEVHLGFMNGMEAGKEVVSEEEQQRWRAHQKENDGKIDTSLARATQALEKALAVSEGSRAKDSETMVRTSSGFSKASESSEVLPFGEI